MYTTCFRVNKASSILGWCTSEEKSVMSANSSAVTDMNLKKNNQAIAKINRISFILLAFALENTQKNHSPKFCFHIINPCTQFADQVLFRRALYASSRGSVSHACPPRQLLPPPTGRHPRMSPSLLNLTGVTLLDQILCCSHIWGCWAFPQRFGPRETQPRKKKYVQVWEVLKIEPSPGQ